MNSLLEDLIGFARENIEKAGVSFAESNQRDRAIIDAYKSGQQVDPEQRQGLMDEMMNQVNPMAGVFGPIRSKAQKHIAKAIFRRDPETFQAIANSPRQMNIMEPPPRMPKEVEDQWIPLLHEETGRWILPKSRSYVYQGDVYKGSNVDDIYNIYGQYADNAIDPAWGGYIEINPRLMRGKSPFGDIDKTRWRSNVHELPGTALHEAQHFLNSPRIRRVDDKVGPHRIGLLVDQLTPLLPFESGDIVRGHIKKGNYGRALNEALSYLAEGATRKDGVPEIVEDFYKALKVKPTKGGYNRTPNLEKIMERLHAQEIMEQGKPTGLAADTVNDALKSEIKPGHGRESLTAAELEMYNKMPPISRPDIPREKFSPGAIEFWRLLEENPTAAKQQFKRELLAKWNAIQEQKAKLPWEGSSPDVNKVDSTFGKFAGPVEKGQAVKVLKDMQDEGTRRMMQMEQSGLSNAEELPRASMDRVIANILDKITGKLVGFNPEPKGFYHRQALQGGVNGMRRALGDLQSINKVDPRDYMRLEDFRALMQHLDKNGLLTDQALQSHLDKWTKQSNVREVRPAPLRRLRRFIEETKE